MALTRGPYKVKYDWARTFRQRRAAEKAAAQKAKKD
jgi:hypothetical protein